MRLALCGLAVLVFLMPVVGAKPSAGPSFELQAESVASSRFNDVANATIEDAALIRRLGPLDSPSITVNGTAHSAVVERYEARWARPSAISPLDFGGPSPPKPTETFTLTSVRFDLTQVQPGAAIILRAEKATIAEVTSFDVRGVAANPCLATTDPTTVFGGNNPNERASWCIGGRFVYGSVNGMEAWFSAATKFYFFNATVDARSDQGPRRLESKTIYEAGGRNGKADEVYAVWFIMTLDDGHTDATTGQGPPAGKTILMAGRTRADQVGTVAMAAPSSMKGTLPNSTRRDGASVWIQGNMSLDLDGHTEPDGKGRDASSYTILLRGAPAAFSYGGGGIEYVAPRASLLAPTIAALLAAGLLSKALWALYAKLRRTDLLKHPVRETIYRIVSANPGIHYVALHRELKSDVAGKGNGILLHHLDQMQRFGLLRSCREGRYRRFFTAKGSLGVDCEKLALLHTPPVGVIALAVLNGPGSTREQLYQSLSESLGSSRKTLSYHLIRLVTKGLVVRTAQGKFRQFSPSPELVRLRSVVE